MATYAEIIYAVLDLLKERSDDAYYTEEHVLFFANSIRSVLLERKYKGSRNSAFNSMSSENLQQICLHLTPTSLLPGSCGGNWLVSTETIPDFVPGFSVASCTGHDLLPTNVTFIAKERMPYVGYNKWLKNIVYACRGDDGRLYLKGDNPQFMYLEYVGLTGVFADSVKAAKLSHTAMTTGSCDIMNTKFPLEAGLIPSLIELVTQELLGSKYAPEDKDNNAKDDYGDINVQNSTNAKPVENTTYRPTQRQEDSE